MAETSPDEEGADLTHGIAASLLEEGKPVAGHVGGEPVLLVRHGGEVFAVGAHCTHHNAPLKDGLVTDGEIRCPWHHACFSLQTGDVTGPPAMSPLARWKVEQRGTQLFVTEKFRSKDPLAMRAVPKATLRSVVIIGGGAAGTSAAEALRINGFKGVITVVDPDADAPYDRPNLSKDYLAGTAPEEWLPLRPDDFHKQHGIRRVVDAATSIDAETRRVVLQSGNYISYDALILATGATPIRPKVPGVDLPHVHVLRTLKDCRALIAAIDPGTKVVIAGASFIGMEAAAALRQRKANVSVVAPELIPFAKVLGPTIGAALMKLHEQNGVQFHMGRMLNAIGKSDVMLDDGSALPAEVVLLGIGVKPDLTLAQTAGVAIDAGVVVNEYLETSVPRIYAAGDIARYPDKRSGRHVRIEHWVVAQRQGMTAACNVLGLQQPFVNVPFFWTQQYDTSVSYVGHAPDYTHIQVDGVPESGDCSASFMNNNELLAYVSIGRDYQSLEVESELRSAL